MHLIWLPYASMHTCIHKESYFHCVCSFKLILLALCVQWNQRLCYIWRHLPVQVYIQTKLLCKQNNLQENFAVSIQSEAFQKTCKIYYNQFSSSFEWHTQQQVLLPCLGRKNCYVSNLLLCKTTSEECVPV